MRERAGFGRRFPALFLDSIFIMVLVLPFGRPILRLLFMIGAVPGTIDTSAGAIAVFINYFWVMAVFYLLIEVFVGATPGKLIMKLRVAKADGNMASWGKRIGRYLGKVGFLLIFPPFGMIEGPVVPFLCIALGLISFLGAFLIFGPRKQTLYDRLTNTAVFKA